MDGLSSEDEQQQPDAKLAVDPGRGGGRGRGRGRGAAGCYIARKVIAREYAAYFMHDHKPSHQQYVHLWQEAISRVGA